MRIHIKKKECYINIKFKNSFFNMKKYITLSQVIEVNKLLTSIKKKLYPSINSLWTIIKSIISINY